MPQAVEVLKALFSEPIVSWEVLPADYEDHASDIWHVTTASEDVIVRASRVTAQDMVRTPFYLGMARLFDVDPRDLQRLRVVNDALAPMSPLRIPKVLRVVEARGRQYAVMERLPWDRLSSFDALSKPGLRDLGRALATHHQHALTTSSFDEFAMRLRQTLHLFCVDPGACGSCLHTLHTVSPAGLVPILVDFYAGQFVAAQGRVTGLVDTEFVVPGPPELELVILEYLLSEESAQSVRKGYESLRPFPRLRGVRPVYRMLCQVMEIHGKMTRNVALDWPCPFDMVVNE
ncbi:MAG: hypothetical protein OWU32_02760 [Firmicutes bacterium]|nr:hypothetical protein [Bacillota bacterium]